MVVFLLDSESGETTQRVNRFWIRFESALEGDAGRITIAHFPISETEVDLRFRPLVALAQTILEGFNGTTEFRALQPQIAETEPGVFPIAVQAQHLLIELFGVIGRILLLMQQGQVIDDSRNVRSQLQRTLV